MNFRKNTGLLCHVLKCVNVHFPVGILWSYDCPLMINANAFDTDLSSIAFKVLLTTPTLLNKVLISLSFHSTSIFFNSFSAWVYPKLCSSWQFKNFCSKEYLSWFVQYATLLIWKTFHFSMVASNMQASLCGFHISSRITINLLIPYSIPFLFLFPSHAFVCNVF